MLIGYFQKLLESALSQAGISKVFAQINLQLRLLATLMSPCVCCLTEFAGICRMVRLVNISAGLHMGRAGVHLWGPSGPGGQEG